MAKRYEIAAIPGDGIGKEVVPEGMRVLEAAARRFGFSLRWRDFDWSCERFAKTGAMMPADGLEQLRALDPSTNPAALTAGSHFDANYMITATGAAGGKFLRQWTVTRDSPAPGLSTVAVSVTWTDGSTRTVRVTGFVCQSLTCS